MQNNFVIISIPRSGSNYLCGILNSHPEIICHHELYHESAIYYSLDHRKDLNLGNIAFRNANPLGFLDSIWETRFSQKAAGFKLFPGHNDIVLNHVLRNTSILKIFLERPNLLRAFISQKIAEMTGIYSSLQGSGKPVRKITISGEEFRNYADEVNRYFSDCKQVLSETQQTALILRYPDIIDSEDLQKALQFLNVDINRPLSTPHQKQGNYSLPMIVENYSQLATELKHYNLTHYLENDEI
jgi:LPS sulfotransferase NodH